MSKAIVLVRVSTQQQDSMPQEEKLIKYAYDLGYKENDIYIINITESGLLHYEDRVGFDELKRVIESDKSYKAVICSEVSRLGRRQSSLHTIKDYLIVNKIQLHIYDFFNVSLLDERGNENHTFAIMFSNIGSFAESEIRIKKERTSTALKNYASKGYCLTSKVLFGYERYTDPVEKKNTYRIHESNGKIVNEIFNWYLYGLPGLQSHETSVVKIARHCLTLKYPDYTHSKRNINKLLKEKAYTGGKEFKFDNGNSLVFVPHPMIVSPEIYEQVQNKISNANTCIDKSIKTTLLAKKIICSSCGNKFTANYAFYGELNRSSYRCGSRSRTIKCDNKQTIDMTMIDSAIWSLLLSNARFIKQMIENEKTDYNNKLASYNVELSELVNRVKDLSKREDEGRKVLQILFGNILGAEYNREEMESSRKILKEVIAEKDRCIRRISDINQNKVSIEGLIINAELLNKEVSILEKDKLMIKKYVGALIQTVEIIQHSRKLSIFLLNFSRPFNFTHPGMWEWDNHINSYPITLIIEKHNPVKTKLFWANGIGRINEGVLEILNPMQYARGIVDIVNNIELSKLRHTEQVSDELTMKISIEDLDKLPKEEIDKLSIEQLDKLTQDDESLSISYELTQIPKRKLSFPADRRINLISEPNNV